MSHIPHRFGIDKGAHFLLGGPPRADRAEHGECAWTLLQDSLFTAHPDRVTKLERIPFPYWWPVKTV